MRNLKKTRRIQVIALALIALFGSAALIGYAMQDGINFFRSPSQVVAETPPPNETFRIGGLVEDGTWVRGDGETHTFAVTDGAASINVAFTGIMPDLFKEGEGTVATGKYINGVFQASEILAKHDETYMPKEVIDALKEQGVYQEPGQEPDA